MRILITGMSGLIGTTVRKHLDASHTLSALNRSAIDAVPTTRAHLHDYDAIRGAFDGQEVVIHLAAKIHDGVGWPNLLETNIVGTRNVFQAAAEAGVRRVVFASSGAVVAGWELEAPYSHLVAGEYDRVGAYRLIDETMPTRPRNQYASTKVFGEALGRHYADNHKLEVACLRIGYAHEADKPTDARQFSVWNSRRDVAQAIRLAATVDLPHRFDQFFILSNNRYTYRSIDRAQRVLGYAPQDTAEDYR